MRQFTKNDGQGYRGALMGVFAPGQDAKIIFGEQYNDSFYATACAYLLRRFGPAQRGCDPYKSLTHYYLTTQMDGVVLTVRPSCSVSTSFGYLLHPDLYEKTMLADYEDRKGKGDGNMKDCKIRGPVVKALCDAMEELKKPVNVRDWYFNIVGRVKDCDLQYDENDENVGTAEYSNLAGYGIAAEYFDRFLKDG